MQCRQNTVVSLIGSIQHCIFFKNWQDKTCGRLAMSQGIICAQKNGRNIHEYLTKIRKSEENLQCSIQHNVIEANMDYNYNNFNNFDNEKKLQLLLRVEEKTVFLIMTFGIITQMGFFTICVPLSLSFMPRNFL